MRERWLVLSAVVLAAMGSSARLGAQAEVTTAPVAPGVYEAFSLTCPANMLVVGVGARQGAPESVDCSLYLADGHRFGAVTTVTIPTLTNPFQRFIDPNFIKAPITTVSCPSDRALTSLHTYVDPERTVVGINYVDVFCAGVGANGGQTTAAKAGNLPTSATRVTNGAITCPVIKFAKGIVGASGGVALVCIPAPVMANSVASVSLSAQHTVGGTAVQGTATLNGFAVGSTAVTLAVTGAPGAVVPSAVTIPDGGHFATFQVQSATSTAGCSMVRATTGATTVSDPLIFTPAPPSGATFSFLLQPESSSLLWAAPSTITALVVFPSTRGVASVGSKSPPPVTFQSDQPSVLAIQTSTQQTVGDTVKVSMSALTSGCAVVTANVNGVLWRKTLRLAAGF